MSTAPGDSEGGWPAAGSPVPKTAAHHDGSPMMRRLILWCGARCLRWFYRDQRLVHAERIPPHGPVVLIGNHPSDLPDVLLGFRTTPRPVRYLATISAASSALARRTYAWLGVIPVTRLRDARKMKAAGVDIAAVNRVAGERVTAVLRKGAVIGVFPEGGVSDTPTLGDFRAGVSMMLLNYLNADPKNDATVVPFGLQYETPRTAGSDVLTVVGEPFSLRGWYNGLSPAQLSRSSACAAELTARLRVALMGVTRNAERWDSLVVRNRTVAALAAVTAPHDPLAAAPALYRVVEQWPDGGEPPVDPEQRAALALAALVERAGGIPTSARDHATVWQALGHEKEPDPMLSADDGPFSWLGHGRWLATTAPLAMAAWLIHGPILQTVWWLAGRMAVVRTDRVAKAFVPGLHVVAVSYLLLLTLAGSLLWPWASPTEQPVAWGALLGVSMLLPRLGDFAVRWRWAFRRWRLAQRAKALTLPAEDVAVLSQIGARQRSLIKLRGCDVIGSVVSGSSSSQA
jgi:1-acyl-sn-glycerol-3-phosphate acyltransferase